MDTIDVSRRGAILTDLLKILEEVTSDWDVGLAGAIGPETRLVGDLGFESIDAVQLIIAIEEHYQRRDLPFEELFMAEGRYVDEVRVSDAVDFLARHLGGRS
jgi:acyl carrier protein